MKKIKKSPKNFYQAKLLQEFNLLKSEEAMQEVLEYAKFVRQEEKELQRLKYQQNILSIKTKMWYLT